MISLIWHWRFNSHATRGNSLRKPPKPHWHTEFQFPCYAREFTKEPPYDEPLANSFNSHATRGNSLDDLLKVAKKLEVSIPMLRAGIHEQIQLLCPPSVSFNSHATRGNSRLASAMPILSVFQRSIVRIGKIS